MDLAIAMTTAPRKEPTVKRSIASLRRAGFEETVHVFAEPGSFGHGLPEDPKLEIHMNDVKRGCFQNWKYAVTKMLELSPAPWILIVQDDAIWQRGSADILKSRMAVQQDRRTGFLSLYASSANVKGNFQRGWNATDAGWGFWGAVALCLKRVAAEELLQQKHFVAHKGPQQVDAIVAKSMLALKRPCYIHVPSMVDHIGNTSTIGNGGISQGRRGYRFRGRV
jgi:hypothetical protein